MHRISPVMLGVHLDTRGRAGKLSDNMLLLKLYFTAAELRSDGQGEGKLQQQFKGEFTTPLPGPLNKPFHLDKPVNLTLKRKKP